MRKIFPFWNIILSVIKQSVKKHLTVSYTNVKYRRKRNTDKYTLNYQLCITETQRLFFLVKLAQITISSSLVVLCL